MGGDDDRSRTVPQRVLELAGQGQRDRVGGLVEEQEVGSLRDQHRQGEPALLTATEYAHRPAELARMKKPQLRERYR